MSLNWVSGTVKAQFDGLKVQSQYSGRFKITPINGWTAATTGLEGIAYGREGSTVFLQGQAAWHTGVNTQAMVNLPDGFRPGVNRFFDVYNVTTGARHSCVVGGAGDVGLTAFSALPANNDIISFDSVRFHINQPVPHP